VTGCDSVVSVVNPVVVVVESGEVASSSRRILCDQRKKAKTERESQLLYYLHPSRCT